jgi:probable HAF family extracellular repeat protein
VVWNGATVTNLTLQTGLAMATAINDSGQIAGMGYAPNGAIFSPTAARVTGTTLTYLDRLKGADNYANAINNAGQVVGYSDDRNTAQHAALWNGTTVTDLGALVGTLSRANAINNVGQIVGNYYTSGGIQLAQQRAVMWTWNGSTAVAVDLNTYLTDAEKQDGWVLQTARGINDNGWIVGNAINNRLGGNHAYLLATAVAVPEPQTYAMLLVGLALIGGLARRRATPGQAA